MLAEFVISKFQSPETNPGHAQLIFTTHDTELLNMEIIWKDQVYFVDKDRHSGVSELFNLTEFQVRTNGGGMMGTKSYPHTTEDSFSLKIIICSGQTSF